MKRMAKPEEIADSIIFLSEHVFLYFWNYTNCRRRGHQFNYETVIIGYGSIGKHASVLTKSFKINSTYT